MYVNQLWAAENEANMSPLQKWTCLSVFELLLGFLSFEHSKHNQKICGYRFLIHCMNFLKKWCLYLSIPTNEHFVSKSLTKLALELQKIWKKWIFFDFLKWSWVRYMVIISSLSTLRHPKPHSSSFSSTWEQFKALFANQNSHHEQPIFNSAQLNQL